jgi:hypothetical protein
MALEVKPWFWSQCQAQARLRGLLRLLLLPLPTLLLLLDPLPTVTVAAPARETHPESGGACEPTTKYPKQLGDVLRNRAAINQAGEPHPNSSA